MSKLFKLKEWLTLEEAANYLSACFNEPVTQADTIRLAIDGHLILSVNFLNSVYARCGKAIPNSEHVGGGIPFNGREVLMFDDNIISISGIYDLPMIGGEINDCEHKFQKLMGGPLVLEGEVRGAFVRSYQYGHYYQLQEYFPDADELFDFHKARHKLNKWDWKGRLFDDVRIEHYLEKGGELKSKPSRDDVFVVRTSALRNFIDETVQPSEDKPLVARERDTLLAIIAALCKDAGYDSTKHAKTAGLIQSTAAGMGVSIGESTIEGHLKKIPNALAGRMK